LGSDNKLPGVVDAMRTILLSILWGAMRSYVGGGLFDRVAALVALLQSADMSGSEKRQQVMEHFAAEVSELGSIVIAATIEVVLLKLRT
jgi:hypothetical protein